MTRVLLLCWRDSRHPQGGGSERYLERVGAGLAARGYDVHLHTSRPRGSRARERHDGIVVTRLGGRLGVYPLALAALAARRLGLGPLRGPAFDVVVDTQNGVPFFAGPASGLPSVVLEHHCHREQWPVAGVVLARLGWWIESRLSPRAHRGRQYVTVSTPSADELVSLGVRAADIAIVRGGIDPVPDGGRPDDDASHPRLVVLSRLVPHKHVEDAIDVVAALRRTHPGLVLDVVGDGWWAEELHRYAAEHAPADAVVFHGHLDEAAKHRVLGGARVHLMPSRKEGWGLAVLEAAQHGVPTVGYDHSVGLRDSIVDGVTGVLVGSEAELAAATAELLGDDDRRASMGAAARERAEGFGWDATVDGWERVLGEVLAGRRIGGDLSAGGGR